MNMPGFTAEVSIYHTDRYYHGARLDSTPATQVVLAIPTDVQCANAFDICFSHDVSVPTHVRRTACGMLRRCGAPTIYIGSNDYLNELIDFAICIDGCGGNQQCIEDFC